MEKLINVINLLLSLACTIECLLIIQITIDRSFRTNLRNGKFSVMSLLDAWRKILVAISLYGLREAYYILEQAGLLRIYLAYALLDTLFLAVLALGLYLHHQAVKEIKNEPLQD